MSLLDNHLYTGKFGKQVHSFFSTVKKFMRDNLVGTILILGATLLFFSPMLLRLSSYSEGGDAMFNAWTLARDHNCILRKGCPSYADSNIFFPNKSTMMYSESQLSTGLLTLPLHFIDDNPIFAYSVWTIVSFFLMGWFMYLFAKYLSKGNETISTIAGLIFAFSPFRMSAISHLQNNSIFYLPLILLLILKFFKTQKRGYAIGALIAMVLQFYASWYQMAFVLVAVAVLLIGAWLMKLSRWREIVIVGGITVLAVFATLPLAIKYVEFSKSKEATFSVRDQAEYSSSLADYVIPDQGTAIGKIRTLLLPNARRTSYNPDSESYYGITLYAVALFVIIAAYKYRKKGLENVRRYKLVLIFVGISILGVLVSLGPVLKIKAGATYPDVQTGLSYVIPLPYILVSKLLPQLSFIRALGRAGVLFLFALCSLICFAPLYADKLKMYKDRRRLINGLVIGLLVFELMPLHRVPMRSTSYSYNLSVPKVYQFIKNDSAVNNIVILSADWDYPNAGIPIKLPEQVLWAGYHNKNIFNGYSGYLPPQYYEEYYDFVDFHQDDIAKLNKLGIKYILVDTELSTSNPLLPKQVQSTLGDHGTELYKDKRFVLFKI